MLTFIPCIFSFVALLLTAYFAFRKEGQEEKQAIATRLAKLEVEQANQIVRQQGFQVEIENVADYGKRERSTQTENTARDLHILREQIKDVPTMQRLVYQMVERMENTKQLMDKLDHKMDRIVELLTHK